MRHREERLGAECGDAHPRQVGRRVGSTGSAAPTRAGTSRWPGRATRSARTATPRAGRPPHPQHRSGAEPLAAAEHAAEHREVQRHPPYAEPGRAAPSARRPSAPRCRSRSRGQRRIRSRERPSAPQGTKCSRPQPARRRRRGTAPPRSRCPRAPRTGPSAIENPRSTSPSRQRSARARHLVQLVASSSATRRTSPGSPARTTAIDRLPDPPHRAAVEGELVDVQDRLVAELEGVQAGPVERLGAALAGGQHRRHPAERAGLGQPGVDRAGPGLGVAERVARGER